MKETKHYCIPTRNIADHRTFGGIIYESDFYRYTSMKAISDRIIADRKFNYTCKQNIIGRNYRKSHKTEGVA